MFLRGEHVFLSWTVCNYVSWAACRTELSLVAYSAVVGAMPGKVSCLRCELCPAVGGCALHGSDSKSFQY